MTGSTLAFSIVHRVLANLERRKGVSAELDQIDREIYDEMVEDLVREVDNLLPPQSNARLVLQDAE